MVSKLAGSKWRATCCASLSPPPCVPIPSTRLRTRNLRFEFAGATIAIGFPPGGKTPPTSQGQLRQWRQRLRSRLRLEPGGIDVFGRESSFNPDVGANWAPGKQIRGYYIDFTVKAEEPHWPTYWLQPREKQEHVATAQWGLGCFERYLNGDGEEWLEAARSAGRHLLDNQHRGGVHDGGWQHLFSMPHTYRIEPPWLSAMAQGEGASLLVRLYRETGDERYAEAARLALKPMSVPVSEGGTLAELDGAPFVEEYPTTTPSCVLNGAIFALWGYYDVGHALEDKAALETFEQLATALASSLWRYDTGYWSRYDLYPHALPNVASPAYHLLHVRQLRALARMAPRPEFEPAIARFERYRASRLNRSRAMAQKVAFRIAVPRNSKLAHRLPWHKSEPTPEGP